MFRITDRHFLSWNLAALSRPYSFFGSALSTSALKSMDLWRFLRATRRTCSSSKLSEQMSVALGRPSLKFFLRKR
jgi:hypothetical protein